jgi:hypothetical protein
LLGCPVVRKITLAHELAPDLRQLALFAQPGHRSHPRRSRLTSSWNAASRTNGIGHPERPDRYRKSGFSDWQRGPGTGAGWAMLRPAKLVERQQHF